MKSYSMKCSCGQLLKVQADSREEGVDKMAAMMDEKGLDAHWSEFHKEGDTKPTVEQAHMLIEQMLVEGDEGGVVAPGT